MKDFEDEGMKLNKKVSSSSIKQRQHLVFKHQMLPSYFYLLILKGILVIEYLFKGF